MKISNKLIKDTAKRADELKKWENPVLEFLDGVIYKHTLKWFSNTQFEKIPEQYQDDVIAALEAFAYNQPERLTDELRESLNKAIDLPVLDEQEEDVVFKGLLQILVQVVIKKAA